MHKMKIYLASSWFTPATREILSSLETLLDTRKDVELYSPRRDGIVLPENQKHDTELRTSIFNDNISHIKEADYVVANIYSGDSYNDTGTIYEIGYALANHVPVIGFSPSTVNIEERFKGILGAMHVIYDYRELSDYLDELSSKDNVAPKILFVGSGNKSTDDKLTVSILDRGLKLRWVDKEDIEDLYSMIDDFFDGVDCLLAVIDDRRTLVSWMIGQAYARNIPVITYSDFNYGINIMLLVSVLTHIRGTEEFDNLLQTLKKSGLNGVAPFDISQINAM